MKRNQGYSLEELIKFYTRKTKELGHIPLAKEINEDPEMPAYVTFSRKFGTEEEIIKRAKVESEYHRLARVNNQFCNDCLYDPQECDCEVEKCKDGADLYYRFLKEKA